MKIKSLYISNILSFGYIEDIEKAPNITFDKNFNILIGQNGAGKSTVLEIINFIFRRVLFVPYSRNQDLYQQRSTIDPAQKKTVLSKMSNVQYYRGFRLDRNYDFENKPQKLRIVIEVDDIDKANMQLLQSSKDKLASIVGIYSAEQMFGENIYKDEYQIDITLDSTNQTYSVSTSQDFGYTYLSAYNLYKEVIELYNEENLDDQILGLAESFALIGCYRNYSSYALHASLGGGNTAPKQIQNIRVSEFSKSTNAPEGGEPSIFSIVRLKMADECFNLISTKLDKIECERAANQLDFIKLINEKLTIVNLKVEIKLLDHSSWNFNFLFIDTRRNREVQDINALSAGQKSIIHLVFEAYGRGSLKGGLVIIDEPEIHLHYQFQNEYLRVIEKLNREQGCQYILVTHSESLINSETIGNVVRLSLDEQGYSKIYQPNISADQKWLVKILDNTRSTHAFFGSKVLLVEGEDDRYFFHAIFEEFEERVKKGVAQDITVLDICGKGNSDIWKNLFESFGLKIFMIKDLDASFQFYPQENAKKINTSELINQFLTDHPDVTSIIESQYTKGEFILKEGDLEAYLGLHYKGLAHVINFCHFALATYLSTVGSSKVDELKMIIKEITGIAHV